MNVLASIAVRPAATMRSILDQEKRPAALPVVIAAVVSYSLRDLDPEAFEKVTSSLGLATTLLLALAAIAATVLVAMLFYFVVSGAATAAGRWMLGGTGGWRDVRQAIGWGLAPQVWALLFRLPAALLWPEAVATLRGNGRMIRLGEVVITPLVGEVPLYQLALVSLLEIAFLIWYLVTGSQTLAVAHGFSPMRGLANLLLAVILPFAAILVIVAAVALAFWTAGP